MPLNKYILGIYCGLFCLLISCKEKQANSVAPIKIAFLADVHLQDIYAKFTDTDYKGILNPETGKYNTIRTMGSQLQSTRLFNENYFAFKAALDDVIAKGVKLVVLPGDFSDDGQPMNIRALNRILTEYTKTYGIQFLLTTGNHDPVRPFSIEAGKEGFLGTNGKRQSIYSDSSLINTSKAYSLPPVVTKDIQKWGYSEIINELSAFGFYPKQEHIYWETPYSTYSYEDYTYEFAKEEAGLTKRVYQPTGQTISIPDATYLVEPVDGLWLLAIDGNVYIPRENTSEDSQNDIDFSGASIGYNHVLDYKKQLISWVEKVSKEAKERGKKLIAFSHYPMVEFNDGASKELQKLFGTGKMQTHRIPDTTVSEVFADAGIQVHIGGHMHSNDTGIHRSKKGNTLFNIQVPSLAAYPPAYKIATLHAQEKIEIETILLNVVSNYNALFPMYLEEYQHLEKIKSALLWNDDILNAKSYLDFTKLHLQQLVQLRFLQKDWPLELKNQLLGKTGWDLLFLNTSKTAIDTTQFENFKTWSGIDMVHDFYKLKSGDDLAKKEIGSKRLAQYEKVCSHLIQSEQTEMKLWGQLFQKSMNGEPSNHFMIDLQKGAIENILITP